jgi:hypothetical protein
LITDVLAAGPCDGVVGPAGQYCGGKSGSGAPSGGTLDKADPLHELAQQVATAAAWTARQLGTVVLDRNAVDLTNSGFLKQYAIVFAGSTVLVAVLWLLAVAKRAVRGVPFGEAVGEAVGLLWIAVMAAAFTPLILYTVVSAVGEITEALAGAVGTHPDGVFGSLGDTLKAGKIGGGPIVLIIASTLTIALCGALWLLMVLRTLSLYAGAVLGVVVYSGFVDRDLWSHIRRWAALMIGIILIEPIVVIVLGLASAMEGSGQHGPVITGLAISAAALAAALYLITRFPGFGDSIKTARMVGRAAGGVSSAVTGGGRSAGAAAGVQSGITTHSNRGGGGINSTNGTPRPANPVSGGIAAHGNRDPKGKPKKDGK